MSTARAGPRIVRRLLSAAVLASMASSSAPRAGAGDPPASASPWEGVRVRRLDDRADGIIRLGIVSPWQEGETTVRVRPPRPLEPGRRYPVVFLLPVEARDHRDWGDPMTALAACPPETVEEAVFVVPEFSHLPWFADHPNDRAIRQETHFLRAVVPMVEDAFPVRTDADGRLLVGFSKSGWGAWSLLLRHPGRFGRAIAWDAPLMTDTPDRYGMRGIFGTNKNFAKYRITTLVEARAEAWKSESPDRLVLFGRSNFIEEHRAAHALLESLGVPHRFEEGPRRRHHWESGWLAEALEFALTERERPTDRPPQRPTNP